MKLVLAALAAAAVAGCATSSPVPPGLTAGKFVAFSCADGRSFSIRASDDGDTVRVRALHGSAELDRKGPGVYEGDGYRLTTEGGFSLLHAGKPQGQGCQPAA